MGYFERIEQKLTEAFRPSNLIIEDESHRHAGHNEKARDQGETHFRVTIVSETFKGQSRVDRQRAIYKVLSAELEEQVHALALKALTEEEQKLLEST